MFGSLGGPEILLIFIVALIVFGPKRLPEMGRKVGELLRELRRTTGEFRSNIEREIGFDPIGGLEMTKKARRDILTTVSEPIREVAQGTLEAAREAREEAAAAFKMETALKGPVPKVPETELLEPDVLEPRIPEAGVSRPVMPEEPRIADPGLSRPVMPGPAPAPQLPTV